MKLFSFLALQGMLTTALFAQSNDQNYTQTIVPKEAMTLAEVNTLLGGTPEAKNQKLHNTVTYYDGLGRVKQEEWVLI